jgi:hypothetical protein
MFIRLLSYFPSLRQQAIVTVSKTELHAVNARMGASAILARKIQHPGTLIGDFHAVSNEFEEILRNIFPRKWIKSDLLICMVGLDAGGYTNLEIHGFREIGFQLGAKAVFVAEGNGEIHVANEIFEGKKIAAVIVE